MPQESWEAKLGLLSESRNLGDYLGYSAFFGTLFLSEDENGKTIIILRGVRLSNQGAYPDEVRFHRCNEYQELSISEKWLMKNLGQQVLIEFWSGDSDRPMLTTARATPYDEGQPKQPTRFEVRICPPHSP